jgi:hypothetical protein
MRLAQVELQEKGKRASIGAQEVDRATPPQPERAIESVQRDVEHVKGRARR